MRHAVTPVTPVVTARAMDFGLSAMRGVVADRAVRAGVVSM